MATYLDDIVAWHRQRAANDPRSLDELLEAVDLDQPVRGFRESLTVPGLSVIAEIKRRSPSKGLLADELDPCEVACDYETGGAASLSVLTDEKHFGGSAVDLAAARASCGLPVLRKDFTVTQRDVVDARLMGADAVLLIAAVLTDAELASFADLAGSLGIDALVEVHDEKELDRALGIGCTLIGVNQRDLETFEVDTNRAVRVASEIPDHVVAVAESGVRSVEDAQRLAAAGYDAILVGESLVTSSDRSQSVWSLGGFGIGARR